MSAAPAVLCPPDGVVPAATDPGTRALRHELEALRTAVGGLSPSEYRAAPSRASGSIGAHVRHALDHVRALVSRDPATDLTYDARLRGTAVETSPQAAVDEIDRLCEELARRALASAERLRVVSLTAPDGQQLHAESSLGRELAFVLSHTIHHAAIVAVLLDRLGTAVPEGFGHAPSTLAAGRPKLTGR